MLALVPNDYIERPMKVGHAPMDKFDDACDQGRIDDAAHRDMLGQSGPDHVVGTGPDPVNHLQALHSVIEVGWHVPANHNVGVVRSGCGHRLSGHHGRAPSSKNRLRQE